MDSMSAQAHPPDAFMWAKVLEALDAVLPPATTKSGASAKLPDVTRPSSDCVPQATLRELRCFWKLLESMDVLAEDERSMLRCGL